jgi:two-component system nitrate/nitrite response regulator NarP
MDVAAGKMVFPFIDVRGLQSDPIQQLTRREKALLEALANGLANKDLAREFDISTNTVKYHLSNLFEKLGVTSRTQAVAYYFKSR